MSALTAAFFRSCRWVRGAVAAPTAVQPGLLLPSELAQIADAGAGRRDESCGPGADGWHGLGPRWSKAHDLSV